MVRTEPSFQLLYISRLASECEWDIVKEIVAASRPRNAAHGITGALLFDGERFCQLIEGAEERVRTLLGNIASDPRHTDVRVICAAESLAGRVTQRWVSGYCDFHELEPFDGGFAPGDRLALHAFASVLKGADVE